MTTGERVQLLFTTVFSIAAVVALIELVLIGEPPRHCNYMVAVKSVPGVYSCSEHPRVKAKP